MRPTSSRRRVHPRVTKHSRCGMRLKQGIVRGVESITRFLSTTATPSKDVDKENKGNDAPDGDTDDGACG